MSSNDSDLRYMATNDLIVELSKEEASLEETIQKRLVMAVLKLLDDKNSTVQNLAIKGFVLGVKVTVIFILATYTTTYKHKQHHTGD